MNTENTFVKMALGFVNIILAIFGIALVLSACLLALNVAKIDLFPNAVLSISTEAPQTGPLSAVLPFVSLAGGGMIWYVLFCVRQFFLNILEEKIFVSQNVQLAKRVANLLFLAAFMGKGVFAFNGFGFFDLTFIITSLVVWTLAKVLEKANHIAEENEFTI